jgi:arginine:pyruvate transaminase
MLARKLMALPVEPGSDRNDLEDILNLMQVTGLKEKSDAFAHDLLMREHVAVLPCDSFGPSAAGHLRISLTAAEPRLAEAGRCIVRFAHTIAG